MERSFCETVVNTDEEYVMDKDHLYQPFDFFTQRKAKRFFKEDLLNLTKVATNVDYVKREEKREIDSINPNIRSELLQSEIVYNDYLSHKANDSGGFVPDRAISHGGMKGQTIDSSEIKAESRYANVYTDSPTWKSLRTKYRFPEQIQLQIEESLVKEIPETSEELRKATSIPIKHKIDKLKIKKKYREFIQNKIESSSDSEYERANLRYFIKKKEN